MFAKLGSKLFWGRGAIAMALELARQKRLTRHYRRVIARRADWDALETALYVDALETALYLVYHHDDDDIADALDNAIASAAPFSVTGVSVPRCRSARWWAFVDALESLANERDITIAVVPCGELLCRRRWEFGAGQVL